MNSWVVEFKRGCTSTDKPDSGRLKTATALDMTEKVHYIVLDDRRAKVREINILSNSNDRVHRLLNEELEMKKYLASWVHVFGAI